MEGSLFAYNCGLSFHPRGVLYDSESWRSAPSTSSAAHNRGWKSYRYTVRKSLTFTVPSAYLANVMMKFFQSRLTLCCISGAFRNHWPSSQFLDLMYPLHVFAVGHGRKLDLHQILMTTIFLLISTPGRGVWSSFRLHSKKVFSLLVLILGVEDLLL